MRSAAPSRKRPTPFGPGRERSDQPKRRVIPRLEDLETRVALTASALDPSFGQGGVVLGPIGGGVGASPTFSGISAVTVQSDGKIVEAEAQTTDSGSTTTNPRDKRRGDPAGGRPILQHRGGAKRRQDRHGGRPTFTARQ